MRSSRVVRASDCHCHSRNSPGFDPSILWHSGIWARQMKQCWIKYIQYWIYTKQPATPCVPFKVGSTYRDDLSYTPRQLMCGLILAPMYIRILIIVLMQDNPMVVPVCSRSKDIVEPIIKPQWWVLSDAGDTTCRFFGFSFLSLYISCSEV
jgi:hypothetical protein